MIWENNFMTKKNIVIVFLLIICLLPINKINAQKNNTTKDTISIADAIGSINIESAKNIRKIIGENTPEFLSKPIIATIDALEVFRLNNFNNPFIFYGILSFIFVLVIRFIWRLIF
jgi:hypothetical protein